MNYAPMPFLRIGLLLTLSIYITEKYTIACSLVLPCVVVFALCITWFFNIGKSRLSLEVTCKNLLFVTLILLFGVFITVYKQQQSNNNNIPCYDGEPVILTGFLQEELKSNRGGRYIIEISSLRDCNNHVRSTSHMIIAVFHEKDLGAPLYKKGDKISLTGKIYRISKTNNPEAFDYASYLYYQGIFQQVRVGLGAHCQHNEKPYSLWTYAANSMGNYASTVFEKYLNESHKPLADALLLGRRADLQNEMYELFTITGCIHVLSVSGMHVGIFAAPLLYLITRLKRTSLWIKLWQLFLLISLIWFYVVMTGSSPSVVRSGVMISILCFGQIFMKRTSGVHVLFLTLVIMLLVNPYYLFQVSFQFSFLSLLSLQLFYSGIKNIFLHKWGAINYVWEISAASIAAQILILPVSIYYFHMFPVYFILGSILAVPMVSLIIYTGTLMVVMEPFWPSINKLIRLVLEGIMEILLKSMDFIVGMPYSALSDIYLGLWGLLLFMAAVFTFLLWYKRSRLSYFYGCCAFLFCGIAENKWHWLHAGSQKELVVYDIRSRNQVLIDIIQGRAAYCITSLTEGHKSLQYAAGNYRISRRIGFIQYNEYQPEAANRSFSIGGFNGMVLAGYNDVNVKMQNRTRVHMLYITGNSWGRQAEMYQFYKPKYVVLHSSLSRKEYYAWVKVQQLECFILHDSKNEGAFTLKM